MEWDAEQLADLIIKCYTDKADAEERALVEEFLSLPNHREKVAEILSREGFEREKALWDLADQGAEASRQRILSVIERQSSETSIVGLHSHLRRRFLAAASLILILSSIYLLTRLIQYHTSLPPSMASATDLQPGGQHATLTLSTGRNVLLDDLPNGQIAKDAGSLVQKQAAGRLNYISQNAKQVSEAAFNTLSTPRGGTYQVVLPDHSIVVLNSESSLTYPIVFPRKGARVVELAGEAYFIVSHDPMHPFNVRVNGRLIKALGTSFDLNAYTDEPWIKSTLLEGLMQIVQGPDSVLLHPGQQAAMKTGQIQVFSNVDTDAIVGWKNGDFVFNSAPLDEVMRQLGRWYDVNVQYDSLGVYPGFTADISRNRPASEVLKNFGSFGLQIHNNWKSPNQSRKKMIRT